MSSTLTLLTPCFMVALAQPFYEGPHRQKDHLLGMRFVPLPRGTFYMGWDGVTMPRKSTIKEDFEMAIHPVTQAQWEAIMHTNPSYFSRSGEGKDLVKNITEEDLSHFPVESISLEDVRLFIDNLNNREKGRGYQYRLPSEAEWEYACRNGSATLKGCSHRFYFDTPTNDISSKRANFDGREPAGQGEMGPFLGRTTRVGSYPPSKLGLYDMHGNVAQMCKDLAGEFRVSRGGGWACPGDQIAAHVRGYDFPTDRSRSCGFRLVRVQERSAK